MSVVICRNCGLIQTNPHMNQKSYNEFYDKEYRGLYMGKTFANNDFFERQVFHGNAIYDLIKKVVKKPFKNKFVVEIGTGSGGILQVFKNKKNKILGVDLGSKFINFGRNKGLNLKIGTINELKKIKEKPDLVIYSQVLEHILNPIEELKELRKYLKPSSLVYIEVPGIKNLTESYNQDFLKYLQNAHIYHFTLRTLNNVSKKAGFKLVYGNEGINSIWKVGDIENNFNNDYDNTIKFLKKLERLRKNPFNFLKIKSKIISFLVFFCKSVKILNLVRKLYHTYKYRKWKN